MNFPALECDRFDDLGDAVSLRFTRDEKNQRSDQQPAERWHPKDTIPRQVGQGVQRGLCCADRQPLDKVDQLSKDDGPTASDNTDGTGKGDQRKRLYPLKLLTQPMASGRGEEQRMALLFCGYRRPGTGDRGRITEGRRNPALLLAPVSGPPSPTCPSPRVSLLTGFWAVKPRSTLALTFHRKTLR